MEQENGETFFDGVVPTIKPDKMRKLYQEGNNAVHKFIDENCSWISEVKEFDICDASGKVHLNVFTKFSQMGGEQKLSKRSQRKYWNAWKHAATVCYQAMQRTASFLH